MKKSSAGHLVVVVVAALALAGFGISPVVASPSPPERLPAPQELQPKPPPITGTASTNPPKPYRWASSGGGWRAMCADMGFAHLFYQLGLIGGGNDQQEVTFSAISTNSGGTWFATQFFYSQNFYDNTVMGTTTDLYNFVVEWMDTYLKLTQEGPQQVVPSSIIDDFLKLLGYIESIITDLADLVSAIRLMINFGDDWYFFINEMLRYASTFSYNDADFVSRAVTPGNRIVPLQNVNFIAQTTLAPQSRNRSLELLVDLGPSNVDDDDELLYAVAIPVTYTVVGSSSSGSVEDTTSAEFVYGGGVETLPLQTYQGQASSTFRYDNYENYYLYPPGNNAMILTFGNLGLPGPDPEPTKKPKMNMMGGMKMGMMNMVGVTKDSKKSDDGYGSRQRKLRGLKTVVSTTATSVKRTTRALGTGASATTFRTPFSTNSVTATPTTSQIASISSAAGGGVSPLIPTVYAQLTSYVRETSGISEFIFDPLIEELYKYSLADGVAVCSQAPNPCGENDGVFLDGGYVDNLALVANVAQYQKDGGDPEQTLKIVLTNDNSGKLNPLSELIRYFNYTENEGVEPGNFLWGEFIPIMSPQIFDKVLTAEDLEASQMPTDEGANVTTISLTGLQTLDNPRWEVKAGYTVDLLIINTNSDVTTFVIGEEFIKLYTPRLANLAANSIASNAVLMQRVKDFFGL